MPYQSSPPENHMEDQPQLSWIANFIWGIADDVLRDLYVRGKYRADDAAEAAGFPNAATGVTTSD